MSRPFIVLGDKTSHGGTVISADFTCDINGKYMARQGDMVVCPKCKGIFAIKTAAPDTVDAQGRGYARHMDMTDCGARLISGQITTVWVNESSSGDSGAEGSAKASALTDQPAAPTNSGICLDCLSKAALVGSSMIIRE